MTKANEVKRCKRCKKIILDEDFSPLCKLCQLKRRDEGINLAGDLLFKTARTIICAKLIRRK